MSDFIINYGEQIPFPAYAENNKFLPLSSIDGTRKYALYTYNVNPPNISLSAGQITVDIDDIDVKNWDQLIAETYTGQPLSADVTVTNQISSIRVTNLDEISAVKVNLPNSLWVGSSNVSDYSIISYTSQPNLREIEIQNRTEDSIYFFPSATDFNNATSLGIEIFPFTLYSTAKDFVNGVSVACITAGDIRVLGHFIG
jgi:hypothetical protein